MAEQESGAGPRGVLHPERRAGRFTLTTLPPGPELAPYVEYHWIVRWDVTGQPPHEQQVLSHPNVHLVLEPDGPLLYGVIRGVYTRRLVGAGQVHGVRFLPGGFRAFADGPVQELTDQVLPAARFFGPAVDELCPRVLALADPAEMTALVERLLRDHLPAQPDSPVGRRPDPRQDPEPHRRSHPLPHPDPQAAFAAAIVAEMTADHSLVRVEQVAARFESTPRTLQRLFAEYVGVSPKAVLRRARLQEAAQRADSGPVDWAFLAADLGYSDQAHLTRDFTATVGVPPSHYARDRAE